MAAKFVKVIDADKLDCTIEYLKNLPEVDRWAKSVGISAATGIRTDGFTYLVIEGNYLQSTLRKPRGSELNLEYTRSKWAVKGHSVSHPETIMIEGRTYVRDEIRELLKGKDIAC